MGRLIVNLSMSLDGVIQAPGRPDEDTRGGFAHGGWAVPYFDPVMAGDAGKGTSRTPLLFGRRTYQDFFAVWPQRTGNPFSEVLDNSQKYVASTTLGEPLPWHNSTLLSGEARRTVAALKRQLDQDLVVLGSVMLVRSLLEGALIDRLVLAIHPLVLGDGRRLFPESGKRAALHLVDAKSTKTGVVLATYEPTSADRPSREV